jgi:RNA polymerase sigma-70 factor (ECF subfamily)
VAPALDCRKVDYSTRTTLLTRVFEGIDPSAWTEFHDRYGDLIRGFAIRQGLQPADCDDVVQEVLLALTKSINRFEYDPARGKFRSYLKTLVIRTIFRKSRQERGRTGLGDNAIEAERTEADPAHSTMWESEWRQHHIRRAMQRLKSDFSEQDRMAFTLYAIQGGSAARTAEILGMSVDQVYQAKSRILRRLSELVTEQISNEG